MTTPREIAMLRKIISLAEALIANAPAHAASKNAKKAAKVTGKTAPKVTRRRRTGKELVSFRKMLVAERKRGVPVAELARKHNISVAYIYQI